MWISRILGVMGLLAGAGCAPDAVADLGDPVVPPPVEATPPPASPPPPPPPPPAPPPTATGDAVSFGMWSPGPHDTCTKADHDAYSVVGPDGKRYPTWHPPTGPNGCTFGHEHGKDPRGSDLYAATGDIPFGLANEALLAAGGLIRHEDHVGHKIEWANNVVFSGSAPSRTCDVLVKIHQGSHSPDALTNNLHEVTYHLACDDGAEAHLTELVNIGPWGQFTETCTSAPVVLGTSPPDGLPNGFGGTRFIPTRACVDRDIAGPRSYARFAALTENWAVDPTLYLANGKRIAMLATYSFVGLPARYADAARPAALARTLDLCYEVDNPADGRNMDECKVARTRGVRDWTHPDSPFLGTRRSVQLNQIIISNAGGPRVFYTDAFGRGGRLEPFPGSIRQVLSPMDNDGVRVIGPSVGGDYTARGVHAPN